MPRFHCQVMEDIAKCEEVLVCKDITKAKKLEELIISVYSEYIEGISNYLDKNPTNSWLGNKIDYLGDIEKLKRKLELFLANDCSPTKNISRVFGGSKININNTNNNSNVNTNNNDVNLNVLIEDAAKRIETDETLGEEEIKEILEKICEIKSIYESNEARNKKWFKLREIISWTGTKGLTVGTSILNLITAILNANK